MSKLTKLAAREIAGLKMERQRLSALKRELDGLNALLYSPRGASFEAIPTHGGGNRQEDKLVKMIDDPRRDELKRAVEQQRERVSLIEETLALLSPNERKILDAFYIKGKGMAKIMEECNYSDVQINRFRYAALSKYAYMRGLDVGILPVKNMKNL